MGNYYKLTVTLSNPCSSASEWSYIYVDTSTPLAKSIASTDIEESRSHASDIKIYPNPTAGEINICISNNIKDTYTIELFDVSGRKITTLYDKINLETGNHVIPTSIPNVINGMYIWKVKSNSFNKSGTISISK